MRAALLILGMASCGAFAAVETHPDYEQAHMVLPRDFWVVSGSTLTVYLEQLALDEDDTVTYSWSFSAGTVGATTWTYAPPSAGDYSVTVSVSGGGRTDTASTTVHSVASTVAATKILLIGDSGFTNEWHPCAVQAAVAGSTLLGTQSHGGCAHEGHSGKTWAWFATDPESPLTDGAGALDLASFLTAIGDTPDVIIWYLGTNDTFTTSYANMHSVSTTALNHAQTLLNAWRGAAPSARHAFYTLAPGNALEAAWIDNYDGAAEDPYRWRLNMQWYNRELIQRYGQATGVAIIPTGLMIDYVAGYPSDNALHADQSGYQQYAAQAGAWVVAVR